MPHVSKNRLSEEQEQQLIDTLHLILSRIKEKTDMGIFLTSLLTSTEELMLAKRIAVMLCIQDGMDDTEISNNLHVTRVTVSRLRYFMESRGQGFSVAIGILKKEQLLEGIRKALSTIISYPYYATGKKFKPSFS